MTRTSPTAVSRSWLTGWATPSSASIDGNKDAVDARLREALAEVRDLRSWLGGSGVTAPVKASLDGSLAALEGGLVRAITSAIGVSLTLPPVSGAVLPGGSISGTVDITNDGILALTGLTGSVTVDGLGSGDIGGGAVAPGASAQLPVTIDVPSDQAPGSFDAEPDADLHGRRGDLHGHHHHGRLGDGHLRARDR